MPELETTERGFAIYDRFDDCYGKRVRVQESSSAEEERVWIFVGFDNDDDEGAIHLNEAGVTRLIAALEHWRHDRAQT